MLRTALIMLRTALKTRDRLLYSASHRKKNKEMSVDIQISIKPKLQEEQKNNIRKIFLQNNEENNISAGDRLIRQILNHLILVQDPFLF